VRDILSEFDLSSQRAALMKMGYDESVLDDELNAYAVTGLCRELNKKKMEKVQVKLKKLVEKHFDIKLGTRGLKKLTESIHTIGWDVRPPV
jgi:hypothetical protein